ncbi:unannotated protein [freshwater metagenome]|uniref:Unannotated protein n=1 Tax=freshwater metagenome TaxID=449393 RepID=A0A6J7XU94_9ZZZZ|nr:hypothetical protein [Actinomycetota bacterium]
MSTAFTALIWWLVPLAGLLGALGYVLWVTKLQGKFQSDMTRSVGNFQRFQETFRDPAGVRVIDPKTGLVINRDEPPVPNIPLETENPTPHS